MAQQRPCHERGEDLGERPVDGEDGEQILVCAGEELEEDGGVDWEVTMHIILANHASWGSASGIYN